MSLDVCIRRDWKGFSLDIRFHSAGQRLGILGASGSGKSMTLKCIAGLETPHGGRIISGGRTLFDSENRVNLAPQRRRVGYLFQQYALFPHFTTLQNIVAGLGRLDDKKRKQIREIMSRFRLEGLEGRRPWQLSGGQQQRVALARILVCEPDTLLLDEPFSALDSYLREQLQAELMELLEGFTGSTVLVSHSRDEVYRFCPRLLVLENGRSIATGDTKELFRSPRLLPVARLTGCKNFSRAVVTGTRTVYAVDWDLHLHTASPVPPGTSHIGVRAHDFRPASQDGLNRFPIQVRRRLDGPFEWSIVLAKAGMDASPDIWWTPGRDKDIGDLPGFLEISPEDVLPLSEN